MTHLTIPAQFINKLIETMGLNQKEATAFEAVKSGIEKGYQTDEITATVAASINCSLNTAKGYIGKLAQKGFIKKERYFDKSVGWIMQFSLNDK